MDGRKVAQYQFLEKLGAGGMGEIHKARDTRLNRIVAIKVLPTAKSGDPERRRRFLLEAQAASGLNHPNIITIHDVISENDTEFMVMEYLSGRTLNDLIPKGGVRVSQALNYALQLADALAAAHQAGIVHRDLKPTNIMITESGLVKILDFGLLKLMDRSPASQLGDDAGSTVTVTDLTIEGAVIGTVTYMSPEQAQGKKVDTRSDIFSFGAVLYEMLTGRRAFEGDSSLSTLSSILRDDVKPMIDFVPDVPPQLEAIIKQCMRKNPDERWQTMAEVHAALSALKRESDSGTLYYSRYASTTAGPATPELVAPAAIEKKRRLVWVAAGLTVLLLAGAGGIRSWLKYKDAEQARVAADQAVVSQAQSQQPASKPDGETLTNDGVLKLIQEKIPVELILAHIRSSKATTFDLSTSELIRLSKGGVPPAVIEQMRDPKRAATPPPVPAPVTEKQSTPAPAVAQQTTHVALTDGFPFRITLAEAIPADATPGRPLRFTVTEDLRVQGTVVFPKGAMVYGEITETAKKKKFFGIGNGKLSFSLSKAEAAGGQWLNIRALAASRNEGVAQRPVEVAGKGSSKDIAALPGSEYIAYIDGAQNATVPLN